jgi:hypothetical protein
MHFRREFLRRSTMGMGSLALGAILNEAHASPLGRARRVIHIFAAGGPSHVDTFDSKPQLTRINGQQILEGAVAFGSPFKFEKRGRAGIEVSELFPKLGDHVDDMAIIRSLWTDIPDHGIASRFMHTGSTQLPKPSQGSWVIYGLGSGDKNMPGFVSLGGQPEWRQASFLPGHCQGVSVNYTAGMRLDQVLLNIRSPFTPMEQQRKQLDLANKLNAMHSEGLQHNEQLEARIESFEMAFHMQTEATDAFDVTKESDATRAMYGGIDLNAAAGRRGGRGSDLGMKMLVARRLVERGVRFVQINHGGWDHHNNLEAGIRQRCGELDGPAAALLADLKQRGMLKDTLVIWGGEFGRTVARDRNGNAGNAGRDHNGKAACCWMAGGGVKGGYVHGATDELGAAAVENKVHVHDLHATILALLGFDHTKLTFGYNGRDFRLTDNLGNVVKEVIA